MMRPSNATLDTLIAIAVVSDVIDIHVAILEIYIYLYVLSFRKKGKKLSLGRYPKKYKGEMYICTLFTNYRYMFALHLLHFKSQHLVESMPQRIKPFSEGKGIQKYKIYILQI